MMQAVEVRGSRFELRGAKRTKGVARNSNLEPRTWWISVVSLLLVAAGPAAAQSSVSGMVRLEERPGTARGDMRDAVVYLESLDRVMPVSDEPSLRVGTIVMRGREFLPHVRVVLAGGTVGFPNEDPFRHNVFSSVELGPFDLGLYPRGATRSASFMRVRMKLPFASTTVAPASSVRTSQPFARTNR
jgi:hypothetical protein